MWIMGGKGVGVEGVMWMRGRGLQLLIMMDIEGRITEGRCWKWLETRGGV